MPGYIRRIPLFGPIPDANPPLEPLDAILDFPDFVILFIFEPDPTVAPILDS
jgi:hypothetical protein